MGMVTEKQQDSASSPAFQASAEVEEAMCLDSLVVELGVPFLGLGIGLVGNHVGASGAAEEELLMEGLRWETACA